MPGTPRIGPKRPRRLYIAEHRAAHDPPLTQDGLGGRLGVSGMTISRWERASNGSNPKKSRYGTAEVSWPVMQVIAEALGIEPDDLAHDPREPRVDPLLRGQPTEVRDQVLAAAIRAIRRR